FVNLASSDFVESSRSLRRAFRAGSRRQSDCDRALALAPGVMSGGIPQPTADVPDTGSEMASAPTHRIATNVHGHAPEEECNGETATTQGHNHEEPSGGGGPGWRRNNQRILPASVQRESQAAWLSQQRRAVQ